LQKGTQSKWILPTFLKESAFIYSGQIIASFGLLICIVFLEHALPKESFSVITYTLNFFVSFLFLIDLGIQGDVVRRIAIVKNDVKLSLETVSNFIRLRLIGACIIVLSAMTFGFVAQITRSTHIAIVLLSTSFIPMAYLTSLEGWGYVAKQPLLIIVGRMARLISYLGLIFCLVTLDPIKWSIYFVIFPLVFSCAAVWAWRKFEREKSIFFPFFGRWSSIGTLIGDTYPLIVNFALCYIFGLTLQGGVANIFKETGLSEYNLAATLISPISILNQVLVYSFLSKRFSSDSNQRSSPIVYCGILLLIGTATCTAYWFAITLTPILHIFFSKISLDSLAVFFGPNLLSQVIVPIYVFLGYELFTRKHRIAVVIAPCVSLAILICGISMIQSGAIAHSNVNWIVFASQTAFLLIYSFWILFFRIKLTSGHSE